MHHNDMFFFRTPIPFNGNEIKSFFSSKHQNLNLSQIYTKTYFITYFQKQEIFSVHI